VKDLNRHPAWKAIAFVVAASGICQSAIASEKTNLLSTPVHPQPALLSGAAPDSPDKRIDPNTLFSPFAGVGSIFAREVGCTGTAISPMYILTAGHCFDFANPDGLSDVLPEEVVFHLNWGETLSHSILASAITIHPDYTGFNKPVVNDDIAVITLQDTIPLGVPIYDLYRQAIAPGTTLTLVGYGGSDWGDRLSQGLGESFDFGKKRVGQNNADLFLADDEGSGALERFEFDFDGPDATTNLYGGLTLGNEIETSLGFGDSGGPSFINVEGKLLLAGVNTYLYGTHFGSSSGGMVVPTYASWIDQITQTRSDNPTEPEPVPEPASTISFCALGLVAVGWRLKAFIKKSY
jgi:secreted trypsin-like serine protease